MTTYPFDREFRRKILILCLDDEWMSRYGNFIVRPNYFEKDDEEEFAKAIMVYREKYGRSPGDPVDVIELMDGKFPVFTMDIFDDLDVVDTDLASAYAVQFAKEQAAKLAILDSVDDVESGNIQAAIDRMEKALAVGESLDSPGIDPIRDIDDWLYDYWSNKVPTGWTHIDSILEGGLSISEEGIILGPPNKGKSMSLVNIGYAGASLIGGINVVHFTHEMSVKQVAKRYAARMIFRFPKRSDNLQEYAQELVEAARKLLKGRIRIIGGAYKMTTVQIENHLDRLHAEEFEVGLIVDDYLDLITPPARYNERRFELSASYEWYRSLSEKYSVPVWSASQGNRASLSKEIITMADIAEDIGKAAIADVIISLCQTREEEEVEQCRLFMAKVRDGSTHSTIRCKYYTKQQAIISTELVKYEETNV